MTRMDRLPIPTALLSPRPISLMKTLSATLKPQSAARRWLRGDENDQDFVSIAGPAGSASVLARAALAQNGQATPR